MDECNSCGVTDMGSCKHCYDPSTPLTEDIVKSNINKEMIFSVRDIKSAWKAGKKHEKLYGCTSNDAPDFYSWFNDMYIEE